MVGLGDPPPARAKGLSGEGDPAGPALGVDGCRGGWLGCRIGAEVGPSFRVFPSIRELWALWGAGAVRCLVDIPIGLPDGEASRRCDREARAVLGRRRASSIFNPPVRDALLAGSWAESATVNEMRSGKRISRQTWGLVPRIREMDEFLRSEAGSRGRFRESHPELLFHVLNQGLQLEHGKKVRPGIDERLAILERCFEGSSRAARSAMTALPHQLAQPDDVVDALVAAVVAFRFGASLATLPSDPPRDRAGLPMEIVFPVL